MRMRHFWRWPLLCSMLFGLASAGSVAAVDTTGTAGAGKSMSRDNLPRLAHDPRFHDRIEAIRAWTREARAGRNRPATLRLLADRVERAAEQLAGLPVSAGPQENAAQAVLAELLEGADALRSARKSVRTAGLARIDGALHEHGRYFDPPSIVANHPGPGTA
jgi:hypothetical protein